MIRPPRFISASAWTASTFLRLLLSLLMLVMFAVGGQSLAQDTLAERTPMRLPPPPEEGDPLYRAPSTPGTYTFQWQMLQHGVEWFGAPSYPITVTVREPVNNAHPVGQIVAAQMETGTPYNVSVTVYNNGETTWTRAQGYTLMAQSPHNTMTWGLNRVPLPFDNVGPGQSATFTFQVIAPSTPGAYSFQWGMQREYHGSFGPGTNPVTINVVAPPPMVNGAQVVSMSAPP